MPAALVADWSQVKATAITLGSLRAAAEAHQISYEAVRKRARRESWPVQTRHTYAQDKEAALQAARAAGNPAQSVMSHGVPRDTSQAILAHCEQGGDIGLLTLTEKRRYLAKVIRTPVGQVDEDSDLAQKVKYRTDKDGTTTREIEMPGKLRAIEIDSQLAGDIGQAQTVHLSQVNIRIDQPTGED